MKLSIAMMVKNEGKHLEECLQSLEKLRQEVDCELIIVDTGSTDNTVSIAKRYTDKVYFHQWNDDFSAMRNITIDYCKGEWIFILDGDEALENIDELIGLIKSNKINYYNTLTCKIKNFVKKNDHEKFVISVSNRIFRNDGTFRYEGSVHNQPIFKEPICNLKDTIFHYGYINDDEELMEKKFKRTSELLKKELEKEPKNIYYLFQLSTSYDMHNDLDEALEYAIKSYEIAKQEGKLYEYLYAPLQLIKVYMEKNEYAKSLQLCKEIYEISPECIDNLSYMGTCYMENLEYGLCIESYEKHIIATKNHENIQDTSINYYTLDKINYELNLIAKIYIKKGEYNKALSYLKRIDNIYELSSYYETYIPIYIKTKQMDRIKDLYEFIEEKNKNAFVRCLETNLQKLDEKEKNQVYNMFSDYNDMYGNLNKARMCSEYDIDYLENIDFSTADIYFADCFYYVLKMEKDISKYLHNLKEKNINGYFSYIVVNHKDGKEILNNYMDSIIKSEDLNKKIICKIIQRILLIQDYFEGDTYLNIFNDYIENGYNILSHIYNEEIVNEENIQFMFMDEDAFMMYMHIANKYRGKEDVKYISYMKKALRVYDTMKPGIELLLKKYEEEQYDKEAMADQQMESYKEKVKETIRNLIYMGDFENAENIIREYEKIVNDDMDMLLLKSEISTRKFKIKSTNILQ